MADSATAAEPQIANATEPILHSPPTSPIRPKGILKNASQANVNGPKLQWDEENLALTEINKDSLMKITEPKTPYVRYNAELDEVEGMSEIPPFHLDGNESNPVSPISSSFPASAQSASPSITQQTLSSASPSASANFSTATTNINTNANAGTTRDREPSLTRPSLVHRDSSERTSPTQQHSSSSQQVPRRSSISASTTRSGSTSRSTSFSLPPDDLGRTEFREGGLGLLRGDGNDVFHDDEELDEAAAAKREEFRKARGRHYSNEAEAMKRAQALMAADDDEEDDSADAETGADVEMDHDHDHDETSSSDAAPVGVPGGVPSVPNGTSH